MITRSSTDDPQTIEGIRKTLKEIVPNFYVFIQPYLSLFGRSEVRNNATFFLLGLLSDLIRKTAEPIAYLHGLNRQVIQRFLGAGGWDDRAIIKHLQEEVNTFMGSPDGILIVDPSSFPKKGIHSVGVARQWCGRYGKQDNCQLGVFVGFASEKGHTLVDDKLFLPEEWVNTPRWRKDAGIPESITYKKSWEIADEILIGCSNIIVHGWIGADAEFGRCGDFRDRLSNRNERYLLDIPCNLNFRFWNGTTYSVEEQGADDWCKKQKPSAWTLFDIGDGSKGKKYINGIKIRVASELIDGSLREEVLLITKTIDVIPEFKYHLTNADPRLSLGKLIQVAKRRWKIEDCFERAKGEVGMDHYEVRSWTGWHHHMTLSLLALWFLVRQNLHIEGLFPPLHSANTKVRHFRITEKPETRCGFSC